MLSFSILALLALPLFGPGLAEDAAVATNSVEQPNFLYPNAQEAFRDLLNALPEESLHAALSGLKGFQSGVFESHHRGVEQVHNHNPALATKLIVAAVQDLKKRQTPSNGTTTAAPPLQSSPQAPPSNSPPNSAATPPANTPPTTANHPTANHPTAGPTDRPVIVNVPQTITNQQGQTVVQTTSVLSQATASVPITLVRTTNGAVITTTEQRPAVIHTTTDSVGRAATLTSAAQFAPMAGEVRTETNAQGSTFVTTYTPGGGKISSVKLLTTTDAQGRPSTVTSYTFVDAAQTPGGPPAAAGDASRTTGSPGLQTGAAAPNARIALGFVAAGGVLAIVG